MNRREFLKIADVPDFERRPRKPQAMSRALQLKALPLAYRVTPPAVSEAMRFLRRPISSDRGGGQKIP